MNESPKKAAEDKASGWQAAKGVVVLSIAGFCIFGLSAFGWHMGVALADLTLRICG